MSIVFREEVRPGDVPAVRRIVQSSGFFNPEEIDIAMELVEERIAKGADSGYWFLFADEGADTVGYASFGPVSGTQASFDLYWIAVDAAWRGKGLGTRLMAESEARIAAMGGRRVYVETSSRPQYDPTRGFYLGRGYHEEARLADFYGPGDAKVIYVKVL